MASRRQLLTIALWFAFLSPALAQGIGQAPNAPANPVCVRLEAQLATIDRGTGDSRSEQAKRVQEALAKAQGDLDRITTQYQRLGCQGGGFFLFASNRNPQCDGLNTQMQQARSQVDRTVAELNRLQGGGSRDEQRRAVIAGLAENNCGPQYRAAAVQSGGFLESIFGGAPGPDLGGDALQSSTFRTVCVRTCDGFFFPISFSTVPSKFKDDERACQRMCPATEAVLFSHRNPGEDISKAVSISGKAYTELPNAFRYRQAFDGTCSCKRAGESWVDAMKNVEDRTVERGDIVVSEEQAKALSQVKQEPDPKAGKVDRSKAKPDQKGAAKDPAAKDPALDRTGSSGRNGSRVAEGGAPGPRAPGEQPVDPNPNRRDKRQPGSEQIAR